MVAAFLRFVLFVLVAYVVFLVLRIYLGLKRRLLQNLNGSLYEIFMSLGFSRLVPGRLLAKP